MDTPPAPASENEYTEIRLENKAKSGTLKLVSISFEHGRMYQEGDRDKELNQSDVENHEINAGDFYVFRACGKKGAAVGVEATFKLRDKDTGKDELSIYFVNPWGSDPNDLRVSDVYMDPAWGGKITVSGGIGHKTGPLGDVTVQFKKWA
ncbi:aegerolysin type hemolysin [Aspergillus affinis]|uniref:aegerolysin type hemolysin n=1 Tax=Aspergillus affinis TaxID=1070780 RepID=UPI0022FDE180|nr:aegerolysin type hemolysin [Aspergillus affinis]KAI9038245.1 aegerolysin type hemolysin [Aspergillus affinis]